MEAEELYENLNILYSTTHSDRPEERESSINTLKRELISGVESEYIILKMRQLIKLHSDIAKGKLSSAITGKFWKREFLQSIPYRKFTFDDE